MKSWNYKVITVLLDKKEYCERYKQWKYAPYHYCLENLLERYIIFLEDEKTLGDVMIESRGKREDMRLKATFQELYEGGTDFIAEERFKASLTSKQLKVKPKSNNISGLQLADMVAHPSRRHVLIEAGVQKKKRDVFGDKIIEIIKKKYFCKVDKVEGYGWVLLP